MTESRKVFISYAREDEEAARNLNKRLVNAGFEPWLDKFKLVGGENWDKAIRRALKSTDFVIVCLSRRSVEKRGYLQREFKIALNYAQEMLASDIYILPVRLDDCEVPDEFQHLQWIDLFAEDGWQKLMNAIEAGRERRRSAQLDSSTDSATTSWDTVNQDGELPAAGEIGSIAPILPRGITRPGRMMSLIIGHSRLTLAVFLLLGILLVIFGNVMAKIGRSEPLLSFVYDTWDFPGLRFSHDWYYLFAVAANVLGGALIWVWLLNALFREKVKLAIKVVAGVVLILGALAGANLVYSIFAEEKFETVAERAVFERLPALFRLIERTRDDRTGGFRTEFGQGARPQPWTSAQVVTAVLSDPSHRAVEIMGADRIWAGLEFLEDSRTETVDDPGWGYWPKRGASITEIAAWVTIAEARALKSEAPGLLDNEQRSILQRRLAREVDLLCDLQLKDDLQGADDEIGAWSPVAESREPRTYSTAMAIWALVEAASLLPADEARQALRAARRGIEWILDQRTSRGWSPRPRNRPEGEDFPGLTAQIVYILARALEHPELAFIRSDHDLVAAVTTMITMHVNTDREITEMDKRTPDSDQHLKDSEQLVEGSTFLMYPWALVSLTDISRAEVLSESDRRRARALRLELLLRWDEIDRNEGYLDAGYPYMLAETLISITHTLNDSG